MIIRTSAVKGEHATYANTRGPDGSRYARWLAERGEKAKERYGLDVTGSPFEVAAHLRVMRNARKRERQEACKRATRRTR